MWNAVVMMRLGVECCCNMRLGQVSLDYVRLNVFRCA